MVHVELIPNTQQTKVRAFFGSEFGRAGLPLIGISAFGCFGVSKFRQKRYTKSLCSFDHVERIYSDTRRLIPCQHKLKKATLALLRKHF